MHNRVIRAVERAAATLRVSRMISNTLPQSLIDNPLLSTMDRLRGATAASVLATGKVEIGQGILTALTADRRRRARRRPRAAYGIVSG